VCRVYVRWLRVVFSVARAFQPEICSLRLEHPEIAALWRVRGRQLVSREAAKPRREAPGAVVHGRFFEYEYRPPGRTEYEYEVSFFGGQWSVGGSLRVRGVCAWQ
jgi:hypothetical protein